MNWCSFLNRSFSIWRRFFFYFENMHYGKVPLNYTHSHFLRSYLMNEKYVLEQRFANFRYSYVSGNSYSSNLWAFMRLLNRLWAEEAYGLCSYCAQHLSHSLVFFSLQFICNYFTDILYIIIIESAFNDRKRKAWRRANKNADDFLDLFYHFSCGIIFTNLSPRAIF